MMIDKDIQSLINYINNGQKRIDSAKRKLIELTDDFDIWHKYAIDKVHYPFLLGIDNPIRKFIDMYCKWIMCDYRYITIDVDWIIDALEEMLIDGAIGEDYVLEVKEALRKSNFGSMCINW